MLIDSKLHIKQKESERIAADVEAWLSKGNKAEQVPIGASKDSGLRYGRSNDKTRLVEVDNEPVSGFEEA